ncbi:MAG TPA: nucleotidyltransferase family protein [Syntrophales bacterium]|nr:MAG: nucleotidyltransferase [Deltaproteobacteria bacterium GWA2_54_12]HLA04389.1 nucleotidyltransferase family protein [Syntrophales bacterium]
MNNEIKIDIPHEKIAEFCKKNHIMKLSFFGSVLREDFGPDSDIDVLVDFIPGMGPGFFGLSHMELELSDIIGRKVDLRTPNELSRYFRDEVVSSARTEYAEG